MEMDELMTHTSVPTQVDYLHPASAPKQEHLPAIKSKQHPTRSVPVLPIKDDAALVAGISCAVYPSRKSPFETSCGLQEAHDEARISQGAGRVTR
jgi:hypothetical protein